MLPKNTATGQNHRSPSMIDQHAARNGSKATTAALGLYGSRINHGPNPCSTTAEPTAVAPITQIPPRRNAATSVTDNDTIVNSADPTKAPTDDGASNHSGTASHQNWIGPGWCTVLPVYSDSDDHCPTSGGCALKVSVARDTTTAQSLLGTQPLRNTTTPQTAGNATTTPAPTHNNQPNRPRAPRSPSSQELCTSSARGPCKRMVRS